MKAEGRAWAGVGIGSGRRRSRALLFSAGAGLAAAVLLLIVLAGPARAGGVVEPPCDEAALDEALAGGGLVTFDCGPDPVTIVLTSQKVITQSTTIDGGGLVALSGGEATRLISVPTGVNLTLIDLTLRAGDALDNEQRDGGAVHSAGRLAADNVTFEANRGWYGGAVYIAGGTAEINDSTFISNTGYYGGALASEDAGLVTITGSTFRGSEAGDAGGAIFGSGGAGLVIDQSELFDNHALIGAGGAIYAALPLELTNSAIHDNLSESDGGGVFTGGTTRMENVAIHGNHTVNQSGGGYANNGEATLIEVDVFGNSARLGGGLSSRKPISLTRVNVHDNFADAAGGGMLLRGTARLDEVAVFNNQVDGPAEAGLLGFGGGGLYVIGEEAQVTGDRVRVYGNHVTSDLNAEVPSGGGGLAVFTGLVTLQNSAIYDNRVEVDSGGGVYASHGAEMTLQRSAVYGNQALNGSGGGLEARSDAALRLVNTTISGNTAEDGGGVRVAADGSSASLTNVTLADNTAASSGGNLSGPAAAVTTLLANGTPNNCANAITSLGYNLEDADSCGLNATGDLTNAEPQLGPLSDNGGPTLTHALQAGSAALDAGNNADCPPQDQRGEARPQDGDGNGTATCDIGAYEAAAPGAPTPTPTEPGPTPTGVPPTEPPPTEVPDVPIRIYLPIILR